MRPSNSRPPRICPAPSRRWRWPPSSSASWRSTARSAPTPAPARPSGPCGHGGRQRTYLVHDFGRGTAPAPVVIVLHGGGGNAENAVRMTGFDRIAARDGIIAVYPDGTARLPGIAS